MLLQKGTRYYVAGHVYNETETRNSSKKEIYDDDIKSFMSINTNSSTSSSSHCRSLQSNIPGCFEDCFDKSELLQLDVCSLHLCTTSEEYVEMCAFLVQPPHFTTAEMSRTNIGTNDSSPSAIAERVRTNGI